MNRKQQISWALCMVGQCLGVLEWITQRFRKKRTRAQLAVVRGELIRLRNCIHVDYMS